MGYRSDVGLAITAEALTKVIEGNSNPLAFLFEAAGGSAIKLTESVKKCLSDADEHIKSDKGNHLFIWNTIKWYGFPDSDALESRLNKIDCESYRFIRLGEDDSDTECLGDWYDNEFNFGYVRELVYSL